MKRVIVAIMLLAMVLVGCGSAAPEAAVAAEPVEVADTSENNVVEENDNMGKTEVHYCKVTKIENDRIVLEDKDVTYKMAVEGNEWVQEGDMLLLEFSTFAVEEESENTFYVADGLLSRVEKNEKGN